MMRMDFLIETKVKSMPQYWGFNLHYIVAMTQKQLVSE